MAELHVEKKRKSNTMWIVIGVIVAALIAWMAMGNSDDASRTRGATSGTTTGSLPFVDATVFAALVRSNQHHLITPG
ncbi:MAG: hypothetical protein H7305_09685 [Gemmatimonadaceae bacterium]|nr:hypothetical protein [Gemmatimonadaceae bacterium]